MTVESTHDVTSDWLTVTTADGPMRIHRVRPAGSATPAAAVLVLQEAFGVNEHIQDVARRIAAEGYLALAPELFHRSGGGTVDYSDRETAMSLIDAMTPTHIETDAAAVLEHLRSAENIAADRTAVIGFCFGGRAAVTIATAVPGLAGTVAFYGPGVVAGPHAVLDRFAQITGPVLMLVGEQDPTIPADHVEAIRQASRQTGADVQIELFAGAGHAFHCDARPAMYHPAAAQQAWDATTAFLSRTLPGEGA